MSAKSASAKYMLLDKLAEEKLLGKSRKAARRVNWRAYAVWAKGYRKKFFANFAKAREYWNQIKRLGSVPIIESRRFRSAFVTCTTVSVPLTPIVRPIKTANAVVPVRPLHPHIDTSQRRLPWVNVFRSSPFAPVGLAAAVAVLTLFIS